MKNAFFLLFLSVFLLPSFTEDHPKVLIIGDSISIGYTPFVQEALAGRAEVAHNPGNAQHTGTGLKKLEAWLGNEEWDVIHFNWGLWDLCYRHPDAKVYGNRDKINGTLTFTVEEYAANLDSLVRLLQKTDAKLIFATTTYVPTEEAGRIYGDELRYNEAALEVMKKYDVQVNDLHPLSRRIHNRYGIGEDDVHYTPEGCERLAKKVARALKKAL